MSLRGVFVKVLLTIFPGQRKHLAPPIDLLRTEPSKFPFLKLVSSEAGAVKYEGEIKEDEDVSYYVQAEIRENNIVWYRMNSPHFSPDLVLWLMKKEGMPLKYVSDDGFQGMYMTEDKQSILTWSNVIDAVTVMTSDRYSEARQKRENQT